jgi:predicted transcriptional regulator
MINSSTPFKSLTANEDKENRLIFKALHQYKQPLTRRKLSEVTGLEIATLCRALYNLTYKSKSLRVAKIARCHRTGKRVYHYYFVKTGGQND